MKIGTATVVVPIVAMISSFARCDTHYVSHTGSNQYPYTSPQTAATNMQDAIDAAEYADCVAVAEGEYTESIRMKQGVALQGAGPDLTTLVYEPSEKEAVVLSAKDASISGFSIMGSFWGIRQLEREDQPFTVSNCFISGTTYTGLSFWGEAIISDSDVSNNNFRGLSVWREGFVTVINCTFMFNGQAACYLEQAGTLRLDHCTLAGNDEVFGFYNSTGQAEITNSIVWGNTDDCLTKDGGQIAASYCVLSDPELDGVSHNICDDPGFAGYGAFNNTDNPIYVNCNYSGPEDGTGPRPFTSIGKALHLYEYELGTESPCLGAASDGQNIGAHPDFVPTRPSGCPRVLINVAPGVYNEQELSLRHGEHLRGAGAELTMIDAGGRSYPYQAEYVFRAGNGVTIEGLTIAGALWGVYPQHSSPEVSHCMVCQCYGGFYCYGSSARISRCLIRNCHGGMILARSSDSVTNCTIAANESYGVYSWEVSPAHISDSILWYNGGDFYEAVGPAMVDHCNIQGPDLVGVNGNISTDPLFLGWAGCGGDEATIHVNPNAAQDGDGSLEKPFRSVSQAIASLPGFDYHLTVGSPCLTAGRSGGQIGAFPDNVPSAQAATRLRIQVGAGTTSESDMFLPTAVDLVGAGMDLSVLEGGSLSLGPSDTAHDLTVSGAEGTGIIGVANSRALISGCRVSSCEYGVCLGREDVLQGCEVLNNRKTGVTGQGLVSHSVIAGNGQWGVQICCYADTQVEHCLIADNAEDGVFIGDSSSIVRNCTILRNKRAGIATSDSSPSIDSCVLRDNGCGIILFDSSVLVTNCLIFGHVAEHPGTDAYDPLGVGLPCSYTGSRVINTTIFGNSRGVACGEYGRPELINCIVQGNYESNIFPSEPELSIRYSDVGGWKSGEGNMDADPRFVSPQEGNFRLLPDSPCIDAGTIAEQMPLLDIAGMHRVMFGGKSLGPDMGAFEYYVNDLAPVANGQAMLLTWSSLAGKSYSVLHSEDLLTWNTAAEGIVSWGDVTTSWMDSPSCGTQPPPGQAPRRYYRVVEEE